MTNDICLQDIPSDGISALKFSPTIPNLLLCSSWDNSVRLYDTLTQKCTFQYSQQGPVLDCVLSSDSICYSGGVDKRVVMVDPNTGQETDLAIHENPVKALALYEDKGVLFSGGWDKRLKVVDLRSSAVTSDIELPGKVFSMSCAQEILAVAMSERIVHIYDTRNMKAPYENRESSLKFQTRNIELFVNAEGYAISSIEGRVAIDYIDPSADVQAKKFAFKCHRNKDEGVETIYPVHSLTFHPGFGTLATGGGDGVVSIWDCFSKKRLRQYPKYSTSISALSFNSDGSSLAVASSYAYDQGDRDHPDDCIYIKSISDSEVRPKHLQM